MTINKTLQQIQPVIRRHLLAADLCNIADLRTALELADAKINVLKFENLKERAGNESGEKTAGREHRRSVGKFSPDKNQI